MIAAEREALRAKLLAEAEAAKPRLERTTVYRCPECGRRWTLWDDPDEYQYGHDCEPAA